jgi:hypothetical protein
MSKPHLRARAVYSFATVTAPWKALLQGMTHALQGLRHAANNSRATYQKSLSGTSHPRLAAASPQSGTLPTSPFIE